MHYRGRNDEDVVMEWIGFDGTNMYDYLPFQIKTNPNCLVFVPKIYNKREYYILNFIYWYERSLGTVKKQVNESGWQMKYEYLGCISETGDCYLFVRHDAFWDVQWYINVYSLFKFCIIKKNIIF